MGENLAAIWGQMSTDGGQAYSQGVGGGGGGGGITKRSFMATEKALA